MFHFFLLITMLAEAQSYSYFRVQRTWAAARADCMARGGQLATITSGSQNAAARNIIVAGGGHAGAGEYRGRACDRGQYLYAVRGSENDDEGCMHDARDACTAQ